MAGFGSVSLAQTTVGSLLDQRNIVLYKQPEVDAKLGGVASFINDNVNSLSAFLYEELFTGLLSGMGVVSSIANTTGLNPYGITYIDAKVNIESELCDHPVEDGTLITDASIILPVTAEVTVAMPTLFAKRIYDSMYGMYMNKTDRIMLETKYGVYKNLVLQNMEYTLDADTVDRAQFVLTLREIQVGYTEGVLGKIADASKIANASDATTENVGSQIAVGGIY